MTSKERKRELRQEWIAAGKCSACGGWRDPDSKLRQCEDCSRDRAIRNMKRSLYHRPLPVPARCGYIAKAVIKSAVALRDAVKVDVSGEGGRLLTKDALAELLRAVNQYEATIYKAPNLKKRAMTILWNRKLA